MDLRLMGSVAVVTGASAGIGRAITLALVAEGVHVVGVARRKDALDALDAEIGSLGGGELIPVVGDITAAETPRAVHEQVAARFGTLDIIVNNAGDSRPVEIGDADEIWDKSMLLNFDAARRMTEALLPLMVPQRAGRIINITATSEPSDTLNAGTPPKAALHMWAKALSRVVGADGVTVNSVGPGRILSEQMVTRLYPTQESRDAFARQHIPLGRFGEATELADLVVFLASPRAAYITGQVIHVDGGMSRFAY